MTQEDPAKFDLLVGLVQDVFRLWEVISQNTQDDDLRHGRNGQPKLDFNYLVDTAVVRLYADPGRWGDEYISALPSMRGVDLDNEEIFPPREAGYDPAMDVDLRQAVLEANALITGEFIFSEQLVGDGRQLLISPDHLPEVMHYVAQIEGKMSVAARNASLNDDPYADVRHILGGIGRLNETGAISPEDVLERMRRQLVAGLADVSHSDLLAPHRLNSLFDRNLVGNAAGQAAFTRDVIAPPADAIRWWMEEIRLAKRNNRVAPSPRAVEADAVTLAQLTLLNQDWEATGKVFVLITDDRGLHTAYLRWMRAQRSGKKACFFPLRYSRQYIPILNINDMGGAYKERQIFTDITTAISTFIDTFSSNEEPEDWWADTRFRTPPRPVIRRTLLDQLTRYADEIEPFNAKINGQIRTIVNLWAAALTYAATVKADTIQGLLTKEFAYWRDMLGARATHEAFSNQVRKLARGFEGLATTSTLLRWEIWALEAANGVGDTAPDLPGRRDVASAFAGFSSPNFRGRSIIEAAQEIADKGPDAASVLAEADRDERLLVMAVLCLNIGAWAAAENLLQQADLAAAQPRAGRDPALAGEIRFLHCVARRLSADARDWRQQHAEGERSLRALQQDAARGSLEAARAASELFALHLSAVAWQAQDRQSADDHLDKSLRAWTALQRGFQRSPLMEAEPAGPWKTVRRQLDLNTMVLAFWLHAVRGEIDPAVRQACEAALHRLERLEREAPRGGDHNSIYPDLAEYALTNADRPVVAKRILAKIDAILARDRASNFAFDVPAVDREEYTAIRQWLPTARRR